MLEVVEIVMGIVKILPKCVQNHLGLPGVPNFVVRNVKNATRECQNCCQCLSEWSFSIAKIVIRDC